MGMGYQTYIWFLLYTESCEIHIFMRMFTFAGRMAELNANINDEVTVVIVACQSLFFFFFLSIFFDSVCSIRGSECLISYQNQWLSLPSVSNNDGSIGF